MSAEPIARARPTFRLRADQPGWSPRVDRLAAWASVLAIGAVFVLIGGGNLDPGPIEARLGIAAGEPIGPFGRVFGGWEPSLWPARVAPGMLWAWGEGGAPTVASIRWPAAIAGLLLGLILARRLGEALGPRAAVFAALAWFGSVALIDRSAGAGLDLITGLATVAALDRLLTRGSDLGAGLWSALAFLASGWPPVALIALTTIVIGRREAGFSRRLLAPPALAAVGWLAWALSVAPASAAASALTLPLMQPMAWWLAPGVVALGLPWSPLAALAGSRVVRDGWPEPGRRLVLGWLQVAGASLLVGTFVPGMAPAARVAALAGLAVAAAACAERLWAGLESRAARRGIIALAVAPVALWCLLAGFGGVKLAVEVGYYRGLAIALLLLTAATAVLAARALLLRDPRRALGALVAVAVCLKLAHWGYYVPEWNYRRSQGPWGRAIGQWVPPRWPIYTTVAWPADLAFAAGQPFRQLPSARHLGFLPGAEPKFILLHESEFEHWPEGAPALLKVRAFEDEHGGRRILARTAGPFPWERLEPAGAE